MAVSWTPDERDTIVSAISRHPIDSGRCAALARVVFAVGQRRDPDARGRQVRPKSRARYIIPKNPNVPRWYSHTYVEAHRHAVDAMTGADGCDRSKYLDRYFEYASSLDVIDVDVHQIDPGIEDDHG